MWCGLTTRDTEQKPCCAAEALRRIRRLDAGGVAVGLAMLDAVFEEVAALGLSAEEPLKNELLRQVKIYNYIPPQAEVAYAGALLREYRKGA
ncbi:MAG: hypothetical protein JXA08_02375 [Methanomicrobiaceae archaeon]|nr:hypothetical protein [Methanomicrobiaceae archaeon]